MENKDMIFLSKALNFCNLYFLRFQKFDAKYWIISAPLYYNLWLNSIPSFRLNFKMPISWPRNIFSSSRPILRSFSSLSRSWLSSSLTSSKCFMDSSRSFLSLVFPQLLSWRKLNWYGAHFYLNILCGEIILCIPL